MPRKKKQSDKLRDQENPTVLGYPLDPKTLTPKRQYLGNVAASEDVPKPAPVPKPKRTYEDIQSDQTALVWRLAEEADALLRRTVCTVEVYLTGRKRASGVWAEFAMRLDGDLPEGWECVRPEPFRGNITVEHRASVIRDWLAREPSYVFSDEQES